MPTVAQTIQSLRDFLGSKLLSIKEFRGETTVQVAKEEIARVAGFLKNQQQFDYLVDITGVDHYGEDPRFEVVYEFSNFETAVHLRVKVRVSEDSASVLTLCSVYQGANWHEREIYDLLGINFEGHPDLRRIIMWEGYPYYPLRKDFPLEGKPSEVTGEAFTQSAPLEGGPFVTVPSTFPAQDREPRARPGHVRNEFNN